MMTFGQKQPFKRGKIINQTYLNMSLPPTFPDHVSRGRPLRYFVMKGSTWFHERRFQPPFRITFLRRRRGRYTWYALVLRRGHLKHHHPFRPADHLGDLHHLPVSTAHSSPTGVSSGAPAGTIEPQRTFSHDINNRHYERLYLNADRVKYWLGRGAIPTFAVAQYLARAGLIPLSYTGAEWPRRDGSMPWAGAPRTREGMWADYLRRHRAARAAAAAPTLAPMRRIPAPAGTGGGAEAAGWRIEVDDSVVVPPCLGLGAREPTAANAATSLVPPPVGMPCEAESAASLLVPEEIWPLRVAPADPTRDDEADYLPPDAPPPDALFGPLDPRYPSADAERRHPWHRELAPTLGVRARLSAAAAAFHQEEMRREHAAL